MKARLFRHSGLPPDPDSFIAFREEFRQNMNEIWPEGDEQTKLFLEMSKEDQEEIQKRTFHMEQELFAKYPREQELVFESADDIKKFTQKFGSLCFVMEPVEGVDTLTAYVMDGPLG
jgi:hypothetical protein